MAFSLINTFIATYVANGSVCSQRAVYFLIAIIHENRIRIPLCKAKWIKFYKNTFLELINKKCNRATL